MSAMNKNTKVKGTWIQRFSIIFFSLVLGVLLFWLLGFITKDIGSLRGPDISKVDDVVAADMVIRRNNYISVAKSLGYESEMQMWDDLYVEEGWGVRRLEEYIGYSRQAIANRLKELGYTMHPPGGPNNRAGGFRLKCINEVCD